MHRQFVSQILCEAQIRWTRDAARKIPETLYWGGGTPSELSPEYLLKVGEGLNGLGILHGHLREYTVEMNPESTTMDRVQILETLGVDRWSLGIQTFQDDLLKSIGRQATSLQSLEAMKFLLGRKTRLSLDFMFCLPGQTLEMFLGDLQKAVASGVQHISFYGLEIHEATLLGQQVRSGKVQATDDRYATFYQQGVDLLESAGILRYEVSNFAVRGQESIHNSAYWDRSPYLGLGPGAHSFLDGVRWAAPRKFMDWSRWVDDGCPLEGMECDRPGKAGELLETVWLALRQKRGFRIADIQNRFGEVFDQGAIQRYLERGWILEHAGSICLDGLGWVYMDQIVTAILKG